MDTSSLNSPLSCPNPMGKLACSLHSAEMRIWSSHLKPGPDLRRLFRPKIGSSAEFRAFSVGKARNRLKRFAVAHYIKRQVVLRCQSQYPDWPFLQVIEVILFALDMYAANVSDGVRERKFMVIELSENNKYLNLLYTSPRPAILRPRRILMCNGLLLNDWSAGN